MNPPPPKEDRDHHGLTERLCAAQCVPASDPAAALPCGWGQRRFAVDGVLYNECLTPTLPNKKMHCQDVTHSNSPKYRLSHERDLRKIESRRPTRRPNKIKGKKKSTLFLDGRMVLPLSPPPSPPDGAAALDVLAELLPGVVLDAIQQRSHHRCEQRVRGHHAQGRWGRGQKGEVNKL